jgi:MFS family permease
LGVVWAAGGVVVGLSPPLSETGRGASSPVWGWVFAAYGVYLLVTACRRAADPPPARTARPRHASGREHDRRTAILWPLSVGASVLIAVAGIWGGIASGTVAQVCLGLMAGGFAAAAVPAAVESLRSHHRP